METGCTVGDPHRAQISQFEIFELIFINSSFFELLTAQGLINIQLISMIMIMMMMIIMTIIMIIIIILQTTTYYYYYYYYY